MNMDDWTDLSYKEDNGNFEKLVMECAGDGFITGDMSEIDKYITLSRGSFGIGDIIGYYANLAKAISGYVASGGTSSEFYDNYLANDETFGDMTMGLARSFSALFLLGLASVDGDRVAATSLFRLKMSELGNIDDKIAEQVSEMLVMMDVAYYVSDSKSKESVGIRSAAMLDFTRQSISEAWKHSELTEIVGRENFDIVINSLLETVDLLYEQEDRPNLIISSCIYTLLVGVNRGILLPMVLSEMRSIMAGKVNADILGNINDDSADFLKNISKLMEDDEGKQERP